MKVLTWLSGKKTVIGAVVNTVTAFLEVKEVIDKDTAMLVLTLSSILLGVGIVHKVQKFNKEKNA